MQAALIKRGEELFQQRRVLEAWTYLEAANRCASLPAEARGLFDNVAAAYQNLVYRQQRKQQQWQEAQRQAAAGHLHTAAELVQGLSLPEAQTFEEDLRRQCQRLARYVTKARDYLGRGQYAAARECYRRARQISPQDPEVVALGSELAAHVPAAEEAAPSGPTAQPRPIHQRNTVWRLDTLGVVFSAEEISIGRVGGAATLPLWGKLHWRHALLVRTDQRWQIVPCRDSKGSLCPVRVNRNELVGPALLSHGQYIDFGSGQAGWRFSQPLPQSGTAMLEAGPATASATPLLGAADQKRVILLADQLRIAPHGPAHLRIENLPCRQFRLLWQPNGLVYEVEGGQGTTELQNGAAIDESPSRVYLPSQIVLEGELDESEWLGRVMLQHEPAETMSLAVLPVWRPRRHCRRVPPRAPRTKIVSSCAAT